MKYFFSLLLVLTLLTGTQYNYTQSKNNSSLLLIRANRNAKHIKKLHQIGMKYYRLKKYKRALHYFYVILRLDPKNQDALYNCACMNALLRNIEQTIYYLKELFSINPAWKKKLKPGVERDFRYIKNDPVFKRFVKSQFEAQDNTSALSLITGSYRSGRASIDPEGGRRVYSSLHISQSSISVDLEPGYGPLFHANIVKSYREHGRVILVVNGDGFTPPNNIIEVEIMGTGRVRIIPRANLDVNITNMTWVRR